MRYWFVLSICQALLLGRMYPVLQPKRFTCIMIPYPFVCILRMSSIHTSSQGYPEITLPPLCSSICLDRYIPRMYLWIGSIAIHTHASYSPILTYVPSTDKECSYPSSVKDIILIILKNKYTIKTKTHC